MAVQYAPPNLSKHLPEGVSAFSKQGLETIQRVQEYQQNKRDSSNVRIRSITPPELSEKEMTYDPRLGMFTSESPTGSQGTVYARAPTLDEQQRIREAQIKGGIFDRPIGELKRDIETEKENIKRFTDLSKTLEEKGKELESSKLDEEIKRLEEKNSQGGYWVGSEQDYSKYQKLVDEYNKDVESYQRTLKNIENIKGVNIEGESIFFKPSEVSVGLPFFKKKSIFTIPLTELTAKSSGRIYAQTGLSAISEAGGFLSGVTKDIGTVYSGIPFKVTGKDEITLPNYQFFGKEIGKIVKNPSILKDYLKSSKPDVIYDLVTGEARLPTEKDLSKNIYIPSGSKITKKQAEQVGGFVGEQVGAFGKYFIPYVGGVFFVADVEGEVRPYNYNPISFAKEEPIQATVLGGTLLTLGLLKGARAYNKPIVVKTEEGLILTTRGERFFGGKVRTSFTRGDNFFKSKVKLEYVPKTTLAEGDILIKEIKIKEPKTTLESSDIIGKDYKVSGGGKVKEFVLFPEQKFYQTSIGGRRVEVIIPKGRQDFLGKRISIGREGVSFLPPKTETIYKGIPYGKLGRQARERALKLIEKKGFSREGISQILKYTQPKVVEQSLKKGKIKIKGKKAKGEFEYFTSQPILIIDETLGIKTRGKKDVRNLYELDRKAINKEGRNVVLQVKSEVEQVLGKGGEILDTTKSELSKGFLIGKEFGKGKGYLPFKDGGIVEFKPTTMKKISGTSFETPIIPKRNELNIDTGTTILFEKKINLDTGFTPKKVSKKSSRQSLEKLSALKEPIQVRKPVIKTPKIKTKSFQETIEEAIPTESIWAGTGLYERTTESGGIQFAKQRGQSVLSPLTLQRIQQPTRLDVNIIQRPVVDVGQVGRQGTRTDLRLNNISLQGSFENVETINKEASKLIERQAVKETQATRLALRQAIRESLRNKETSLIKEKPLKTQKVPKINIKLPPISKGKKKKGTEEEEGLFEVFIRKRGEDINIGEFETLPKVRSVLRSELKSTLSASGFVKKGEKKLSFGEVGLNGFEFIPSKRDSSRIVQRREFRLGTPREVFQIQQSKKSKGGFFR